MPTSRRKATWPHASIHNREAENALAELRRGASLHLSYSPRQHWRLSSGVFVTIEAAQIIIASPCVAAVGDCLFDQSLSQTWRYTTENDNA
jgi:hypothetical protein